MADYLGDLVAYLKLNTADVTAHAAAVRRDFAGIGASASASAGQAVKAGKDVEAQNVRVASSLKGVRNAVAQGLGLGAGLSAVGLAAAAAAELKSVLTGMTERALADEESVNRLTTSLRQNVPAWNGDTAAIEQRIKAAQRLGFVDEDLRDSLTLLVGATHDVTKAQDIQGVAMDLARYKGVDLKTASEALIKVEAGVYRSLKSLGIVLPDNATQTQALAAVQAVAAGQAEAYAQTNRGKLTASTIELDEAMESLGKKTMPGVVAIMAGAAKEVVNLADEVGGLIDTVANLDQQKLPDWLTWLVQNANKPIGLPGTVGPEGHRQVRAALAAGTPDNDFAVNFRKGLDTVNDDLHRLLGDNALREIGGDAGRAYAKAVQGAIDDARESASLNAVTMHVQISTGGAGAALSQGSPARDMLAELQKEIDAGTTTIDQAATTIVDRFGSDLGALTAIGQAAGTDLALAIAKGFAAQEDAPLAVLKDLHNRLNSEASTERQEAFLLAALTGADIVNGLKSSDEAVRLQAIATRKVITDQLDILTEGAYSAGVNTSRNLDRGLVAGAGKSGRAAGAAIHNDWTGNLTPIELSTGQKDYLAWLKGLDPAAKAASSALGTFAADAKAKLSSAFDDAKTAARSFFDEIHTRNLTAIDDAKALRDAQIQGPVDAMKAQLAAEQSARREAQLRAALANAKTPADQATAQQDLSDFLAEQQITKAEEAANAAQKISDQQATDATTAENKRYEAQTKAFEKELAALQGQLARHPEQWRKAQRDVLTLLAKYGVNYTAAGEALGADFVTGLKNSLKDAEAAAKALAAAGTPKPKEPAPSGSGYASGGPVGGKKPPPVHHTGSWSIAADEMARLQQGEMVLPRDLAAGVRAMVGSAGMDGLVPMLELARGSRGGGSGGYGGGGASALATMSSVGPGSARNGGGTIVLQIDGAEVARIVDERLAIREGLVTSRIPGRYGG